MVQQKTKKEELTTISGTEEDATLKPAPTQPVGKIIYIRWDLTEPQLENGREDEYESLRNILEKASLL